MYKYMSENVVFSRTLSVSAKPQFFSPELFLDKLSFGFDVIKNKLSLIALSLTQFSK